MKTMPMSMLLFLCVISVVPTTLQAQEGVRVETHEDEMSSWSYAYTRAERGPLQDIGDAEVIFGRSPCLIFLCRDGEPEVIYLYDTELIGADGSVSVQARFDTEPALKPANWSMVVDPTWVTEFEAGMAVLGAEENPLVELMGNSSVAARLQGDEAAAFLAGAGASKVVTMRVMDTFDGETHTDRFSLEGLDRASVQLGLPCGP